MVDVEISDDDGDIDIDADNDKGDELERSRISSASRQQPRQRRRRTLDEEEELERDAGAVTDVATDNEEENDNIDRVNIDVDNDTGRPIGSTAALPKSIPPALLARLLHHFFQNPSGTTTRLTQDAHAAVNKYMEIFVREAVARSVAERGDSAFLDVGPFSVSYSLSLPIRLLFVFLSSDFFSFF